MNKGRIVRKNISFGCREGNRTFTYMFMIKYGIFDAYSHVISPRVGPTGEIPPGNIRTTTGEPCFSFSNGTIDFNASVPTVSKVIPSLKSL